jgi:hypothetical protein
MLAHDERIRRQTGRRKQRSAATMENARAAG